VLPSEEKPRETAHGQPPPVFDQAFLTGVEGVTELLLVRHAQQHITAEMTTGELVDPPLSNKGRLQARCVGEALSTTKLHAIYASPLHRALETARAIALHHELEPIVIDDLREVELFRDIPKDKTLRDFMGRDLLEAVRGRMLRERSWDIYPFSESSAEFRRRVINAIESIIVRSEAQRVAIVCHGGVINAYTSNIIGSPYDMFFRPAHTSVSIVAAGLDRRVVHLLNDTHHLRTAEADLHTY
jgi:2,3-bisphosphoglycerate-dependent phosphoglycerate mutase